MHRKLRVGIKDEMLKIWLQLCNDFSFSLIIRGFNDRVPSTELSKHYDHTYSRYIHDRCFPGIPFSPPGELPPPCEVSKRTFTDAISSPDGWGFQGIAYLVTSEQMEFLSQSSGFRVAQVDCQPLSIASEETDARPAKSFVAYCLVAQEKYRSSCMMPTIT